jgi:acyl carrier protein
VSPHKEIRKFIVDNFLFGQDDGALADDSSLLDHGVIDSTGMLELVSFLENRYEIEVEDEDLVPENLDSVVSLVGFLERKRRAVV